MKPNSVAESETTDESRSFPLLLWVIVPVVLALIAGAVIGALIAGGDDDPSDGSVDAGFLRDMSIHHAQAVRMAGYVYRMTEDEEIRVLAYDILTTQQGQIGIMTGWLDAWGLSTTSPEGPMTWMGHEMSGPMPGLASDEEIAHLESLSGADLDREFLRLMIVHHQGGISMAEAAVDRAGTAQVKDFANAVIEMQSGENAYMSELLAARPA